jgi:hypothetical protein
MHFDCQGKMQLDAIPQINVFAAAQICLCFSTVAAEDLVIDVSEITLEKLRLFTGQSNTLVTIDAPLFGSLMVFNGRVLNKGASYVEPEKIGNSIGFPAYEQVVAEASRFWIVDETGVRQRKGREEMASLLEDVQTRNVRLSSIKSAKSV